MVILGDHGGHSASETLDFVRLSGELSHLECELPAAMCPSCSKLRVLPIQPYTRVKSGVFIIVEMS